MNPSPTAPFVTPAIARDSRHEAAEAIAAVSSAVRAAAAEEPVPFPMACDRLSSLPTYIFAELNVHKAKLREQGMDLIDLGMGNPDRPTPPGVVQALVTAVQDPTNHGYPDFEGKPAFRQAVADWMQRRFAVRVNPNTQVQPLIGSKEGLAHLIQAYLDPGDICLMPSLYYPTYLRATVLAGAKPYFMPLTAENGYVPDLTQIPPDIARQAKLLLINYPNNPTGAAIDPAYYQQLVAFCQRYHIVLVNDMAYSEIMFDGQRMGSVLEVPGAEQLAVEFHSFSKSYNMAGWRIGFAVGSAEVIRHLYSFKTNMDYGVCNAVQDGAIYALTHSEELIGDIVTEYQQRRDLVAHALTELGWPVTPPQGSFYFWLPVPPGWRSYGFCRYVMDQTGVVVTPGIAFGQDGDGFVRLSLIAPQHRLQEAIQRLKAAAIHYHLPPVTHP